MTFLVVEALTGSIGWGGVEVLRGIDYPIRDKDWGTLPTRTVRSERTSSGKFFRWERDFTTEDISIAGRCEVVASLSGEMTLWLRMEIKRDLELCRTGFVLLHPIRGLAGKPMTVRRSTREALEERFPDLISASQPAIGFVELRYVIDGVSVIVDTSGQPFRDGGPAQLVRRLVQELRPDLRLSACLQGQRRRGRRTPPDFDGLGRRRSTTIGRGNSTLVFVIRDDPQELTQAIDELSSQLMQLSVRPDHVFALPAAYLKSFQPDGPWPASARPSDAIAAARRAFPSARIGRLSDQLYRVEPAEAGSYGNRLFDPRLNRNRPCVR